MIYLDNCSTTIPRKEVIETMAKSMAEDFANPSSLHRLGFQSEKKIKKIREDIGSFLNVSRDEIYFTSGGTESNNMAIQSMVNKYNRQGKHLITTKIEHPSVLNLMKYYEEEGYSVTYLDVNHRGEISLEELEKEIREDTILVSIMHVNNEIGTIEPISQVKNIISKKNSKAVFHVDGIQGFGKVNISLKSWGIDSYSFSGHKIYGPKGIGGLYIDKKHSLSPIIYGGDQERGMRSGTENLLGIIGLGKAVDMMGNQYKEEREYVLDLRKYFVKRIKEEIGDIKINTPLDGKSSPYILNISFNHVKGEVLLHYLEEKDIYVSTSSACSSKDKSKSHVLKSIGLNDLEIDGGIRFCFYYENTIEDLEFAIEVLKKSVKEIRQIIMRWKNGKSIVRKCRRSCFKEIK